MTEVLTDTQPIRLKGRSFLALTLSPELPFDAWLARFDDLVTGSAGYFLQRPVVLDVAGIEIDRDQLRGLIDQFGERDVRIVGIEGAPQTILDSDMPPAMTGGLKASDFESSQTLASPSDDRSDAPATDDERNVPSMIVTEPVRSGQRLTCEGDVTIVGAVASGAEVVAGGSIHVYGSLRGRALAGSAGKSTARIFCRKFEAELVAIAGYYMTSEDLDAGLRGKAIQLWLEGDAISAETFA